MPPKPRKPKQSGGIFLGSKPTELKHLTSKALDALGLESLKQEADNGGYEKTDTVETFYDLITTEKINIDNPTSYITFARGDKHVGIYNTSTFMQMFKAKKYIDPYTNKKLTDFTLNAIRDFIIKPEITVLVYNQDGSMRAIGYVSGKIRIQHLSSGVADTTLYLENTNTRVVVSISFHPDNNHLAVCYEDESHYVFIWDIQQQKVIKKTEDRMVSKTHAVFSPSGEYLACVSYTLIIVYSVHENYKTQYTLKMTAGNTASCVAFNKDSTKLVVGSNTGTIYIWEIVNKKPVMHIVQHEAIFNTLNTIAFHPTSSMVATAGANGTTILLWDIQTYTPIGILKDPNVGTWDYIIYSLAFYPEGRYLVAGLSNDNVKIWDIQSSPRVIVKTLSDHETNSKVQVAIHPNGTTLTTAGLDGKINEYTLRDLVASFGGGKRGLKERRDR